MHVYIVPHSNEAAFRYWVYIFIVYSYFFFFSTGQQKRYTTIQDLKIRSLISLEKLTSESINSKLFAPRINYTLYKFSFAIIYKNITKNF